ncbi:hypothetical protein I8Q57_12070 [Klebsiella pneumoniae]|uniref:Uncharacterized protein n=3 Tax=Klebsiella/Raoultella group TaxID=2890311 RepID=A0A9Q9JF58_RAOOR|nr:MULTISPECIES: hypothetical protein [Klebsiella/Raoultella group]EIW9106712.1 hypothetical protein [Klebsiella pneumoniae]EKV8444419.1 hypothetical protein [Klebsiella pneumoniae]ELA2143404.1 hypothetical protein [Klebsiella pneumoniae]ELA2695976.1 hypothetical protein [Klebsiella pneumoniae]MBF8309112.1 hypothetical protein [Klebsiella pneumoniae]
MKVMTDRVFKGIEVKNASVVVGGIQIDDQHTTVTFSVSFFAGDSDEPFDGEIMSFSYGTDFSNNLLDECYNYLLNIEGYQRDS